MNAHQWFSKALQFATAAGLLIGCSSDEGSSTVPMGSAGMTPPPAAGRAGMTSMVIAGQTAAGTSAAGTVAAGRGAAGRAGSMGAGTGGMPPAAGSGGMVAAGSMAMAGGTGGMDTAGGGAGGATMGMGGMSAGGTGGAAGSKSPTDTGMCCDDGNCICRAAPPAQLSSKAGPYKTDSYDLPSAGCVYYPTDADPPFAAVAISDGFLGSGGCGALAQTSGWGPLYASHGIVAMIIHTTGADQPPTRGQKLTRGIAAFKQENMKMGSPLFGKLAGRYGTSGFSMGGGGTSYSSQDDATLKTSVAIMPYGPVTNGIKVPTLVICGSADAVAPCALHGNALYSGLGSVPKMRVTVSSGHAGQPSSGGGDSGKYGLAFQKLFLEGDERWRSLIVGAGQDTNIK